MNNDPFYWAWKASMLYSKALSGGLRLETYVGTEKRPTRDTTGNIIDFVPAMEAAEKRKKYQDEIDTQW